MYGNRNMWTWHLKKSNEVTKLENTHVLNNCCTEEIIAELETIYVETYINMYEETYIKVALDRTENFEIKILKMCCY